MAELSIDATLFSFFDQTQNFLIDPWGVFLLSL